MVTMTEWGLVAKLTNGSRNHTSMEGGTVPTQARCSVMRVSVSHSLKVTPNYASRKNNVEDVQLSYGYEEKRA